MADLYEVKSTSLNLRSRPVVDSSTRIGQMPHGHLVSKLADSEVSGWWKIGTTLKGRETTGYVASRFLRATTATVETATKPREDEASGRSDGQTLPICHLRENRPEVKRSRAERRAYPLGEPGRPGLGSDPAGHIADLHAIVDWLDVERHDRYKPTSNATFCNIYAYDFSYLAGCFVPRVWWMRAAQLRLANGESVPVRYGETVREMNANSLLDWFEDFGADYGWNEAFDETEVQDKVNAGKLGIIVAARTNANRSGHITVVLPETDQHQAEREADRVIKPLQSQAGGTRHNRFTSKWYRGTQFRDYDFWVSS
jgi:hypothetical protein